MSTLQPSLHPRHQPIRRPGSVAMQSQLSWGASAFPYCCVSENCSAEDVFPSVSVTVPAKPPVVCWYVP